MRRTPVCRRFRRRSTILAILFGAFALAFPARAAEVHLFDDSLLEADSPPPANRLPVLFVHGHAQEDNDADLNYRINWIEPLNGLPSMQQAREANPDLGIEPYYIRFEDQNRSITEDAVDIAEAVGAILRRHDPTFDPDDPTDTTPVQLAIVGYSKGTISARQYLKSLQLQVAGMAAPRPDFRPVSEFVAISPPNHAIDTVLFSTTSSLAVKQLYNGYRPDGLIFDCGDSFNTAAATDYIEILNGHPIEDTMTAPFGDFPSEAPGSRPDGAAPHAGVLYVTLYASGNRDFVGGDDPSGDCQGRRVARNLAPDAINIAVPEVTGGNEGAIHQNTVHTKEVLCLALYAVAHHRSPAGQNCGTGTLPDVPIPARAAAMLTLDLSGSMLAPACSGCGSRLDLLKDSVEIFVQLWSVLGGPEDRLGVTYFRTGIDQFSGGALPLLWGNETGLIDDVAAQQTQPFNMTAMGGGLQTSIAALDPATVEAERRHVVLFTDGMQNVNPMVVPTGTPPHHEIRDEPGRPDSGVDPEVPPMRLDQIGGVTVDTIGIGAGEAFVGLLEDIAAETGGVTKATVAPDDELRRFFVEELIAALRGFSPQLVGYRKGALDADGGASETFIVNAGVPKLALKLSWRRGETLGMRVFKDGVDVTASGHVTAGDFYRILAFEFPSGGALGSGGEWRIAVNGKPKSRYEAAAIADEHRLLYEIGFGRPPVRVGERVELQVRLSVDGKPFAGELAVEALLQRPRTAVGSLLAAMKRPGEPVGSEPGQRLAEAQVLALLADKASAKRLSPVTEALKLQPSGDGVYATSFNPTVPGIYTATVTIRGRDPKLGDFERTETATAVVRFGTAVLAASDLRLRDHPGMGNDRMLELVVRPRDRYGNLLGPGLARSLGAELSSGRVVGTAEDLGGGRYLFLLRLPNQPGIKLTLSVNGLPFFEGSVEQLRRGG